jgi:hypothetical protein
VRPEEESSPTAGSKVGGQQRLPKEITMADKKIKPANPETLAAASTDDDSKTAAERTTARTVKRSAGRTVKRTAGRTTQRHASN